MKALKTEKLIILMAGLVIISVAALMSRAREVNSVGKPELQTRTLSEMSECICHLEERLETLEMRLVSFEEQAAVPGSDPQLAGRQLVLYQP